MEQLTYTLVRSRRRTLSLEVTRDGCVVVRAPAALPQESIDAFVQRKSGWLQRTLSRVRSQALAHPLPRLEDGAVLPWLDGVLTLALEPRRGALREGEVLRLPTGDAAAALERWCRAQARSYLAGRVAYFEAVMGVRSAGLRITGARSRWGSCTARNSLNFSWRLMLCPADTVDYVVLHELCHFAHKNHSPAFWAQVARVMPDYAARRARLRERRMVMDFL